MAVTPNVARNISVITLHVSSPNFDVVNVKINLLLAKNIHTSAHFQFLKCGHYVLFMLLSGHPTP